MDKFISNGGSEEILVSDRPAFEGTCRNTNHGSQAGYFDKDFLRLFEGEPLTTKEHIEASDPPFLMGTSEHTTSEDLYGTFDKFVAFSGRTRPTPPASPGRDFITTCGKKGGPGYADICINRYPAHDNDRYGLKMRSKSYGFDLNGPFVLSCYPKPYFNDTPHEEPSGSENSKKIGPQFISGRWAAMYPERWHGAGHPGYFSTFPRSMSLVNVHN